MYVSHMTSQDALHYNTTISIVRTIISSVQKYSLPHLLLKETRSDPLPPVVAVVPPPRTAASLPPAGHGEPIGDKNTSRTSFLGDAEGVVDADGGMIGGGGDMGRWRGAPETVSLPSLLLLPVEIPSSALLLGPFSWASLITNESFVCPAALTGLGESDSVVVESPVKPRSSLTLAAPAFDVRIRALAATGIDSFDEEEGGGGGGGGGGPPPPTSGPVSLGAEGVRFMTAGELAGVPYAGERIVCAVPSFQPRFSFPLDRGDGVGLPDTMVVASSCEGVNVAAGEPPVSLWVGVWLAVGDMDWATICDLSSLCCWVAREQGLLQRVIRCRECCCCCCCYCCVYVSSC